MPQWAVEIPQHRFLLYFQAVCPLLFFSVFGDCQIPQRHPAAFVVDNFFASASSSHCLLSTNAVVGRSFTYSMVSFHNSPRSFPASRFPQSRFSIRSIRLSHCEFQSPLQSALSRLDFSSMELFGELEKETSYTASCRRSESFSSSGIWILMVD